MRFIVAHKHIMEGSQAPNEAVATFFTCAHDMTMKNKD